MELSVINYCKKYGWSLPLKITDGQIDSDLILLHNEKTKPFMNSTNGSGLFFIPQREIEINDDFIQNN